MRWYAEQRIQKSSLSTETPFTDVDSEHLWWREQNVGHMRLMDDNVTVGHVNYAMPLWIATPLWAEQHQIFHSEEEARAWIQVMYRMSQSRS